MGGVRMEVNGRKGGSMVKERKDVKMTCWNCRGLKNSVPFLNALIDENSKVNAVSEHWLWPFELHKLQEVHPEFSGTGKADDRLVEDRNPSRGCGGVGILWHNSLVSTSIEGIASDRIVEIVSRRGRGQMLGSQ